MDSAPARDLVFDPSLNRAWTVLPFGGVIWTTPFGCFGSAPVALPVSRSLSAVGSSTIRWLLPSTDRIARPL